MPSAVVPEMPAGASAGLQRNGVPAPATGSQVAIRRPLFQFCASSCVMALHSWLPGWVFTYPVTGSIGQAFRLPVQSREVSEVGNCAREATDPLWRPVEFTAVEAVDWVVFWICARMVCRSLASEVGSVAGK